MTYPDHKALLQRLVDATSSLDPATFDSRMRGAFLAAKQALQSPEQHPLDRAIKAGHDATYVMLEFKTLQSAREACQWLQTRGKP